MTARYNRKIRVAQTYKHGYDWKREGEVEVVAVTNSFLFQMIDAGNWELIDHNPNNAPFCKYPER